MNNSRRFLLGAIVLSALVMIAPGSQAGVYAYMSDSASGTGAVSTAESFPYFDVAVDGCTVRQNGDRVDVTVSVSNNGSVPDTQTIELFVDGAATPRNATDLTVPAEGTETVTLGWQPTIDGTVSTFSIEAASEDESVQSTLLVIEWWGSTFSCSVLSSSSSGAGAQSLTTSGSTLPEDVSTGSGVPDTEPGGRPAETTTGGATDALTPTNTTTNRSTSTNKTGVNVDQPPSRTGATTDPATTPTDRTTAGNLTGGEAGKANTTEEGDAYPDNSTDESGTGPSNTTDSGGASSGVSADLAETQTASSGEQPRRNATESDADSSTTAAVTATPVNSTASESSPSNQSISR